MTKRVLGLEPGITSIGWALIEENEKNEAVKFIDSGSVIFQPIYEKKNFKLKNQKRSLKRYERRMKDRKKRKMSKIENLLLRNKLLSKRLDNFENLQKEIGNPYHLRAKALKERLSGDELSFAIMHLFKRRGFLSSKKSMTSEEKKEAALQDALMLTIKEGGFETIGEYFSHIQSTTPTVKIRGGKTTEEELITGSKLLRDNLTDELLLIIDRQIEFGNKTFLMADYKTDILLKDEIINQFRFQRPLKQQKRQTFCALEFRTFKDSKTGQIVKSYLRKENLLSCHTQEFKIRQLINNFKFTYKDENYENQLIDISKEQKEKLFDLFWNSKSVTNKQIRKLLNFNNLDLLIDFNYETGLKNNSSIAFTGNIIHEYFTKDLKNYIKSFTVNELQLLLDDILTIKGAEYLGLHKRLVNHWKFTSEDADILIANLTKNQSALTKYSAYSRKALIKLNQELKKGIFLNEAIDNAYGKNRESDIEVLSYLPQFKKTMNPIVNKSVTEVRHLVNAIIKKYGKIDCIRIELARDIGMSAKQLADHNYTQLKNKKANEEAINFLKKNYFNVSSKNLLKYKLYQEVDGNCLFPVKVNNTWTYKKMSYDDVFSSNAIYEVEHLLPISITGDNSFANKSLCPSVVNKNKGNRTPLEYYSTLMSKDEVDNFINHTLKTLGKTNKYKRFTMSQKDMYENLKASASLNDTRYIATELKDYLSFVCSDVQTLKGGMTALLRKELGLNDLLFNAVSDLYGEQEKEKKVKKKTRLDYRHHMVEALAIALSSQRMLIELRELKKLSYFEIRSKGMNYSKIHNFIFNVYKSIKKDFEVKFDNTLTYHKLEDKRQGAFDEDTIYSLASLDSIDSGKGYNYNRIKVIDLRNMTDVSEINNPEILNPIFITSKRYSDVFAYKPIVEIKKWISKLKPDYILPDEFIDYIYTTSDEFAPTEFIFKSGHVFKKVEKVYDKTDSAHFVRNKNKEPIGIKKLGNNYCILNLTKKDLNNPPRIVPLFEAMSKGFDFEKSDLTFKGDVFKVEFMYDADELIYKYYKLYQFSISKDILLHPVNQLKIEKRDLKNYNVKNNNNYPKRLTTFTSEKIKVDYFGILN